ncbi:MarR family winged helix-turn-helix transcriptional regulator [Furfurilactobacillus sp. WILCCON 0119]
MTKEGLVKEISGQLLTLASETDQPDREHQWMMAHIDDETLVPLIPQLSMLALHFLAALQDGPQNGRPLADQLAVTRGGISRVAKRLANLGVIVMRKRPENQKEVFYELTATGMTIATCHAAMHAEIDRENAERMAQFSEAELTVINRFLKTMADA